MNCLVVVMLLPWAALSHLLPSHCTVVPFHSPRIYNFIVLSPDCSSSCIQVSHISLLIFSLCQYTLSIICMDRKACGRVFSTFEFHVKRIFCWLSNLGYEPTMEIPSLDLIVFIALIIIPLLHVFFLLGQLPTKWI